MPKMDGNGPEMHGSKTGRELGICSNMHEKDTSMLGIGLGKRRNSGGGTGLGKRLKYDSSK